MCFEPCIIVLRDRFKIKFLIPIVYFIFPPTKLGLHTLITLKYFLISLSYVKFQNISVNILVHLLESLSFRFRCSSFLLSKFASHLKLIQSVVRVRILRICVTSLSLRVLLSGFWVSQSQVPSPNVPVPGSYALGPQLSGSIFQGHLS